MIESVVIYSTTNCAFCKVLKQWLTSKDVEFEDINVEKEPSLNTFGFQSFPVTVVNKSTLKGKVRTTKEVIVRGFDRVTLQKVLDI